MSVALAKYDFIEKSDWIREIFIYNLLLIAFFDSYAVYASILPVKLFIYGLKMINVFGFIYLLRNNLRYKYLLVLTFIPIWWFYYDESNFLLSLQLLYSGIIPTLTFLLLKDTEQHRLIQMYIKLIIALCIIGIPIYLLINLAGIPPTFSILRGELGAGRFYDNYLLFYWTRHGVEMRFSSVFDEPGVLGTIIPFIILYHRKALKTWQLIFLIIIGFLTMSLFFMIVILPVLYFSNFRKLSKQKQVFNSILFIFIIAITYYLFVLFARSTQDSGFLALKVYYRFKWENNWIVGVVNNREAFISSFQKLYEVWNDPNTLSFYFGYGKNYVHNLIGGTLSYKVIFIERGIVIILYLFMFYLLLHPWRKYFIFSAVSIVFLCLAFFQRPTIYSINYFMLIYAGLYLYDLKKSSIKHE